MEDCLRRGLFRVTSPTVWAAGLAERKSTFRRSARALAESVWRRRVNMSISKLFCGLAVAVLLASANANAAIITTLIQDDFEGYASQAAFNAVWTPSGT